MRTLVVAFGVVLLALGASRAAERAANTTIQSDELELKDNGARTIFRGNVRLTQPPYTLTADQMVQTRATEIVDARGRVKATWQRETGEKVVATGQMARYNPKTKITELWSRATVTRWETAVDTMPVVLSAHHFKALETEDVVWASTDVHVRQGSQMWAKADEAKLVRAEERVYFWGRKRKAMIHYEDHQGVTDFRSWEGWLSMNPKRGRLMREVQGHIVPRKKAP